MFLCFAGVRRDPVMARATEADEVLRIEDRATTRTRLEFVNVARRILATALAVRVRGE